MIVGDPVDVIEDQSHPSTAPGLTLPAGLTATILVPHLKEPPLQVVARIGRVTDHHLRQGRRRAPCARQAAAARSVGIEVVGGDGPTSRVSPKCSPVASGRAIAEAPQSFRPALRCADGGSQLLLREPNSPWHRTYVRPPGGRENLLRLRLHSPFRDGVVGKHTSFWPRKPGFKSSSRSYPSVLPRTFALPAAVPGSVAGPRGGAIPSTRIAFNPRPSFSRPTVEVMSWPLSSLTRSSR